MQGEQEGIKHSHNLLLHSFIDNKQAKSVTLMRLDSHPTLYRDGIESKYLTNLVVAGRDYIELYAIFQNQITLGMGTWQVFEDILQVQQWDRSIVISTRDKVVGLVYEDCMLKNSFMLTLDFLQLGYRQRIATVCDRSGFYMVVCTAREFLLCVSQKCVHRYRAKPQPHTRLQIIQEDIKWNRQQYQSIADVIRFDFSEFELSKIDYFHFCDQIDQQYLYFLGHSSRLNNQKCLYEVPLFKLFSDNDRELLVLKLMKIDVGVRECYVIRKENESQFLEVRADGSLVIKNQKGEYGIQTKAYTQAFSNPTASSLICQKSNNPSIFPLHVYQAGTLQTYERLPGSPHLQASFTCKAIKMPAGIQVQYCDVQDGIFAYCNLYEIGLVYLRSQGENKEELTKVVLRESFGSIVDFNIGQNLLIVENTFSKKCRLRLLRRGVLEHPKTPIMHARKMFLQSIAGLRSIRSLSELISEYEHNEGLIPPSKLKSAVQDYLLVQTKSAEALKQHTLYRLTENQTNEPILQNIWYYSILFEPGNQGSSSQSTILARPGWYFVVWNTNSEVAYYQIKESGELALIQTVQQVQLWRNKQTPLNVTKIRDYLVSVYESQAEITLYNLRTGATMTVHLQKEHMVDISMQMTVNLKTITFKKKEKDHLFLQITTIVDGNTLQIWEISVDSGQHKLSHTTENAAGGLAIMLPSDPCANLVGHEFRAITCPEYVLLDKTASKSGTQPMRVLKMHTQQHQGESYLFIVNSKEQLLFYKKYYCSNSSMHSTLGAIEPGFLYYRQDLQLHIAKKFKFSESTAFVEIGCGILRLCNFMFFKGEILELPDNIKTCFQMENCIWSVTNDGKVKQLITDGKVVSHFLAVDVPCFLESEIVGIQATNENYIVYSREAFEVFDKQLNSKWRHSSKDLKTDNKQYIIAVCAFDHYLATSYYNYCEDDTKQEYKSIKFKVRLYNTITKKKEIEKQNSFEQPVLHLRYVAPDKLILVTSSNVSVNVIKNNQSLQNYKNKHYSKRAHLSCFSYVPEKVGAEPGYMLFGGLYGGVSFYVGQWIDKDKLDEIWFENLKCGINEIQIFRYGGQFQALKALIADDNENIIVMDLKPNCANKLADFHLGSSITNMKKKYEIPYISTADGCIRQLLPVKLRDPEISFLDMQEEICKNIPMLGGFNNRESRRLSQRKRTYKLTSAGEVVDGQLIQTFLSLSEVLKLKIYQNLDMGFDWVKNQLLEKI